VTDSRHRIGYLVSQYPGLSHTFVMREIRGLRALGWDVRVVSIRKADRPVGELSSDEAEEFRSTFSVMGLGRGGMLRSAMAEFFRHPFRFAAGVIGAWRLAGFQPALWPAYTFYFIEAVIAGAWFCSQGVRHVHTHFSSTVALLMSRYFDIDYSATIHGSGEFNDVIGFHMHEKAARAVMIVAISKYGSSQIQRASAPEDWKKIAIVPLGVDLDQFALRPMPSGDVFEIVLVGRIESQKAQHILIRAIRLLRERGHKVHLTLVGDGPTRPLIEQLIRELDVPREVELTGALNHDKVLEYYARANAYVCSSYAEGLPVVLMEAMATGIPCVSTWITGIPELIRDDLDGLLVPPASPEHIADAVERLIVEPGLVERIGKAGRARIEGQYNLAKNIPALAQVFEKFVRQ
jgi:colanic acid/amylovoran biosynthesis glycosyltransferase